VNPSHDPAMKRSEILALAALHGCRDVRVFGSWARGTAQPESDVDLLVDVEPGRSKLDIVALWDDLTALLGCRVDLVTDGGTSPYLRERIYAEAKPL
jgi:predicted nucleotidyltransferase